MFFTFTFTGQSPYSLFRYPGLIENFSHTGTSVEIRHVTLLIPGVVLNPSYFIDGTQVLTTARRDLKNLTHSNVQDHWVYNQTLNKIDGLTNTEHKLEVRLSEPDQLFVRPVFPSFRNGLTHLMMSSLTT